MSGYAELFKRSHTNLTKEDLYPFTEIFKNKGKRRKYEKQFGINFPLDEDIQQAINYLNKDIKHFFFCIKTLSVFHYFDGAVTVDIMTFDLDYLQNFHIKERIEELEKESNRAIENNEYNRLLFLADKPFRFMIYEEYYDKIPNEQKYEVFKDIYTSAEYGFNEISKEIFNDVIQHRNVLEIQNKIKTKLKEHIDKDGMITIYRGQENLSSNINESYSWSVDINTATFFATRYTLEGKVYKGKVHIDDVIDYYDSRSESEIITTIKNVKGLRKLDIVNTNDTIKSIHDNEDLFDKYVFFKTRIDPDLFFNPQGEHGINHINRVLFLTITLCQHYLEELSFSDIDLLGYAAIYHDIGRINDGIDKNHGFNSFRKMNKMGLIPYDEGTEEYNILKFIIEYHNKEDNYAYDNLNNYNINDRAKTIFLYKILKDADNLDRVRFRDLDINYLRMDYSQQLLLFAHHLVKHLKMK